MPAPRRLAVAALLLLAGTACGSDGTAPVTLRLGLEPVDSGLVFPVLATAPLADPDRLFLVQRGGHILLRRRGTRLPEPFLDLSAATGGAPEYGVLGLAFHPDYAANGRFFVYYIDNDGAGRLEEFHASDPDRADPDPVATLLVQPMPPEAIHYGGTIAFGPDGMLYLALGDGRTGGSPESPARDSTSLLGKMLRLDVDGAAPYAIPADNPFVGRPGWRPEIWQRGLRNPYRWSFDRSTGDIWIGDVGEDEWEEVSFAPARDGGGEDFGWPVLEGTTCFRPAQGCDRQGITLPVITYSHAEGCSVTGGHVYRGSAIPDLRGTYLYGDFCGDWIRWLPPEGTALEGPQLETPIENDNVLGFGEDASGELYVVMLSGYLYRLVSTP